MTSYQGNPAVYVDEIAQKVVSVGVTATELFTGVSRNPNRQYIRIYNDGNRTCFIGPTGVTASGSTKGEALQPSEALTLTLGDVAIFGITSNNTTSLIITELS